MFLAALFGIGIAPEGEEGDFAEVLTDAFVDTFGQFEKEEMDNIDSLPPARSRRGRGEAATSSDGRGEDAMDTQDNA